MSNAENAVWRGLPGVRLATVALAILGALAARPDPVLAQQESIDSPFRWRERGFRLGFFGGFHAANRGPLEFGQGPTPAGGAKLRVRASSPLSFELGATYGPAERWVVDVAAEGGPAIIDTVAAGWLRADAGVQVALTGSRTWNGIQPYGLFGGGFVFGIDEEATEALADPALEAFRYDISTAPHIFLGLGFEIFPSDKVGISFEARDYLIRLSAPDGFLLPDILAGLEETGAPAPDGSAWQHNPEFGLTIWYYF